MKTLKEVINSTPVYLGIFGNKEAVAANFGVEPTHRYLGNADYKEIMETDILFAFYEYEDWSGNAFVLFHRGNKLFEVNGSHCSCYGLEDQWAPEETTLESLALRFKEYHGYSSENYYKEIRKFLGMDGK